MLNRLALALLIGGIAGYLLAKSREQTTDDIDWDEASETLSLKGVMVELLRVGPYDAELIQLHDLTQD